MSPFLNRMLRAAKLDVSLYEEVEKDTSLMKESVAVVVLSSLAAGIGLGGYNLIGGTIMALIGWYVWAYLTFFIGTKLLAEPQTESNPGELLRTIGFSSAPGLIRILAVIPILRDLVMLVSSIWMLCAMVVAVRQALDFQGTGRAVMVCVFGWVIQIALLAFFFSLAGS